MSSCQIFDESSSKQAKSDANNNKDAIQTANDSDCKDLSEFLDQFNINDLSLNNTQTKNNKPDPNSNGAQEFHRKNLRAFDENTIKEANTRILGKYSDVVFDIYEFYELVLGYKNLSKICKRRKNNFKNMEEYANYLMPCVINETKAHIENKMNAFNVESCPEVIYPKSISKIRSMNVVKFETFNEYVAKNDVILLYPKRRSPRLKHMGFFGIVTKIVPATIRKKCQITAVSTISQDYIRESHEFNFDAIDNAGSNLREYRAIFELNKYRYLHYIVCPHMLANAQLFNDINIQGDARFYQNPNEKECVNIFKLNVDQERAVETLNCENTHIALIQGPPGTGKTTLISAFLRSYFSKHRQNTNLKHKKRVLVCARSNAAVDVVARKLVAGVKLTDGKLFKPILTRVGRSSKISEDIHHIVLENILGLKEDAKWSIRDKRMKTVILQKSDIVFATLNCSGSDFLFPSEVPLKFDLLIIDEACQAVEVSTLIPFRHNPRKIVLIGDPRQLAPTVIGGSKRYETSLFERLSKYLPVIFLREQYRMDESLVELPNRLFYNGLLRTSNIVKNRINPFSNIFPNKINLVHVDGNEERDDNLSFYNLMEATLVSNLCKLLLKSYKEIKSPDIGVITPYGGHKTKILELLNSKNEQILTDKIDIDTVDAFQGKEKDIVIISMVRSENVGFISDPRRINVALTRSKYCIVIFANINLLKTDPKWNQILEYYTTNKLIVNSKCFFKKIKENIFKIQKKRRTKYSNGNNSPQQTGLNN